MVYSQEKDLKSYMDECNGILSLSNVKVSRYPSQFRNIRNLLSQDKAWATWPNSLINNINNNNIIIQFIYSWLEKIANVNKGQLYPIYNI